MDEVMKWVEPIFRWAHVVAGVLWIGLLYFFNWVNGPFGKSIDAETKQKALPELLPRTLYFFRWGAAYTWITGILLLAVVYYHSYTNLVGLDVDSRWMAMGAALGAIVVGLIIYDILWKAMQKQEMAAMVVSFVLLIGVLAGLYHGAKLTSRALFIHTGAIFGTAMAFNVWYRIWPAQRRIIAAIKAGNAPDPKDPALAGLRSKHNTYMSVPLLFMMVSNHFGAGFLATPEGAPYAMIGALVAVGWIITKMIYKKSAGEAPKFY